MKSTLILFSIIGLILISDINPAYAVADSCLRMVENNDVWTGFNPDSVMVDLCKGSPTFGKWYSRNGYLFGMTIYPISPKPIPPGSKKTWRDIDSQYISIKNSFQALEEKFGNFTIRRQHESSLDSIELAVCVFILDFTNYILVDSALYYLKSIDSVMDAYLEHQPTYVSVDPPNYELKNIFSISPNPTTDFIQISVGANGPSPLQSDVRIFDLYGQSFNLTPTLSILGEGVRVDVSGLAPGMYFVRIGDKIGKFVKLQN